MIKINLLTKEQIAKEEHTEIIFLAILAGIVIIFVLGYVYFNKTAKRSELNAQIKTIDNELAALKTIIDQINDIKGKKNALDAKKKALEELVKSRLMYPILFEDLVKIIPSGAWLQNLNTRQDKGGITMVTFSCSAFDNYIVADLLQALENSPVFSNPEISAINTVANEKGTIKQFSITVSYKNQEWK